MLLSSGFIRCCLILTLGSATLLQSNMKKPCILYCCSELHSFPALYALNNSLNNTFVPILGAATIACCQVLRPGEHKQLWWPCWRISLIFWGLLGWQKIAMPGWDFLGSRAWLRWVQQNIANNTLCVWAEREREGDLRWAGSLYLCCCRKHVRGGGGYQECDSQSKPAD